MKVKRLSLNKMTCLMFETALWLMSTHIFFLLFPKKGIKKKKHYFVCKHKRGWSRTQIIVENDGGGKIQIHDRFGGLDSVNDPSAGSPTETLLRLLLPLNVQVCVCSQKQPRHECAETLNPRNSLIRSIGSSDGRCVQRAGT